jgi:hypothetical protein
MARFLPGKYFLKRFIRRIFSAATLKISHMEVLRAPKELEFARPSARARDSFQLAWLLRKLQLQIIMTATVFRDLEDWIYPCGNCRQTLAEFGDLTLILTKNEGEETKIMKLSEIHGGSFATMNNLLNKE